MDKEEGGREWSLLTRPRSVKTGPQVHVHDLHYACEQLGAQAGRGLGPAEGAEPTSREGVLSSSLHIQLLAFFVLEKTALIICHKIRPFKTHSSAFSSKVSATQSPFNLTIEHFITRQKPCPLQRSVPVSPALPQPRAITHLLPVSTDSPVVCISKKQNQGVGDWLLSLSMMVKVHPCCDLCGTRMFSRLNSTPRHGQTAFCLSRHQLTGVWFF